MEVYLDGRALDSREALHQALSALLAFPAYYGKNLDALPDGPFRSGPPDRAARAGAGGRARRLLPELSSRTVRQRTRERALHPHLGGISMPRTRLDRRSGAFLQLYGS